MAEQLQEVRQSLADFLEGHDELRTKRIVTNLGFFFDHFVELEGDVTVGRLVVPVPPEEKIATYYVNRSSPRTQFWLPNQLPDNRPNRPIVVTHSHNLYEGWRRAQDVVEDVSGFDPESAETAAAAQDLTQILTPVIK